MRIQNIPGLEYLLTILVHSFEITDCIDAAFNTHLHIELACISVANPTFSE